MFIRSIAFLPLAGFMFATVQQSVAQTCLSYGIDFVSGGAYFINTNSNDDFTAVTQFTGCQNDTADIILTDPNGDDTTCSDVPLQPDSTSEISTCAIEKSQMFTGDWELTILSNNGDGDPIAYQRDFYISAGPQQTVTATATVIFNQTVTPSVTSTTTKTVSSVITVSNSLTTTIPSATQVSTVTPPPTYTTSTTTITRTLKTWTRTAFYTTVTVTATCTVPPRPQNPDPTWHRRPQIAVVLPTGLSAPNSKRESLLAMRDALRQERRTGRLADEFEALQIDKRDLAKRSADLATTTITQTSTTATSTSTFTAPTSTVVAVAITTVTSTSYLPPITVYYGVASQTVTAAQQTKTRFAVTTTYSWVVRTMTASFTSTSTVTPSASVTACKSQGGHFGGANPGSGYGWWNN